MFICVHLWLISLCLFTFSFEATAQVRPVYDYGAIGLGQLLKRLTTTKSVMMIGAHPDDEDSALLAYFARGENARTAYLSLTRGDGGQNVIGSELFESLGVIRTEELLQARRLDGAEQFFTRAFDFGFTKTLAETKSKWDEKIILCDAVRAIRTFRPLVVVSRFAGTTADGHGQHQYSGYISPLAVRAAADGNQCKDAGAAWQVLKFYVEQGFRDSTQPTLKINTGAYDFLLGRSYAEIAAEGRSLHRTQEQGGLEIKGDRFSGLNLIESKRAKVENERSVFDGIDTTPKNLFQNKDEEKKFSVERALREYEPNNPQKILPVLIENYRAVASAEKSLFYKVFSDDAKEGLDKTALYLLEQREKDFAESIKLASGIRIDALTNAEIVVPNETFQATVKVFYPNEQNVKVKQIVLKTPDGWTATKIDAAQSANQNQFRRETANEAGYFNVKVAPDARPTEPFWLERKRTGDLFDVPENERLNLPFAPSLVICLVVVEVNGTEINLTQPVEFRYADSVRGEVRRELNVVPKLSLSLDQKLLIVPRGEGAQTRRIVLSIANNSAAAISGEARLDLPSEIKVSPASVVFNLKNKDEKTSVAFEITVPAEYKIGDFELGARATANGEIFTKATNTIAYPHIQTHRFYTDAKAKIEVFDLKVAPVRVGYITGSGDDVPEAIRRMGLTVDLLSEADLQSGDLQKYDAIVVGIRAFQTRDDLIASNKRILDFVNNGGTLIVQYQRPDYVARNLQPFPASMTDTQKTTAGTTARVVDENAKVTILQPQSPVFNFPNQITNEDFDGWLQERNLYNFTTFDEKYTPLLEAHDAGETENKGGMVLAKIGRGNYVYTSYAFFRQLPAGVPGAYRLFANLLSLPKAKK